MTTIHFFAEEGCKGASSGPVKQDVPNLSSVGFLQRAKSLRVSGNPCIVFKEKDFKGNFALFQEGDCDSLGEFSEAISSVRVVKGGLRDPEITVYEHINYGGKATTLTSPTPNLNSYEMNNMISSHKVTKGAWRLYEKEDYDGSCIVALAGDNLDSYLSIGWNDTVNSLKPYKP
ncbi:hypothetical protein NDU88_007280 [Pleurodeles waltl]|uniref:Beta/gamma crystallin 'Greek key' domain-containing protein n=1 Tax=Pleurodeles waltl TaxID=8319 RepID=A0AAV7WGL6_PLEWA|nr:hypothetical protein NDU88_007277 [Pleurodeles waltl]KAJ1211932.1 hypothetical protein NDU88_007280 [Pleurodeles waltl]